MKTNKNITPVEKIEEELNKIRVELHEERKHLSTEEKTRLPNDNARKIAEQYGFDFKFESDN